MSWVRWAGWWAVTALAACNPNPGGSNRGARSAGSGHGGIEVAHRELAISPDGQRALYSVGRRVRLIDLGALTTHDVPAPEPPGLVAFRPGGHEFFVKSREREVEPRTEPPSYAQDLAAFDGERPEPRWRVAVAHKGSGLTPLASGAVVVWGDGVELLHGRDGARSWRVDALGAPVDLDEVGGALLVTEVPTEEGKLNPRRTALRLLDAASGEVKCQLLVDNCTDEVVATPDGRRVFLAPTFCGQDPVSVVDLQRCAVERTLPGFGPVALAAGGKWAVAFADRQADEAGLLPLAVKSSERRYHLLRIDPTTLALEPIALGDWLPRYATTTAGARLLVDTSRTPPVQVRLVDLEQRTVTTTAGPAVPLEAYSLSPDGQRAFVLSNGLYVLRFDGPQLDSVPLKFLPVSLNLTPDGKLLLLRDDEDRVHLIDTATMAERAVVAPPGR